MMRFKKVALFAVCLAFLTIAFAASAGQYLQYDMENPQKTFEVTLNESVVGSGVDPAVLYQILRVGQIVIVNDRPKNRKIPWMTTGGTLVNAPPQKVYDVITDLEHYPEFMPQTESATAKKINDRIDHVFYELGIQVLFFKIGVPYSVYHYNQPPNRVDWVMAGGDFKANYGAYEVVAVPGQPNRSMLFYTSYSKPTNKVVNTLLKKMPMLDMMINLSTGTLVVNAMAGRAEKLYAASGGKTARPEAEKMQNLVAGNPQALATLAKRGKLIVLENGQPAFYSGVVIVNKAPAETFAAISDMAGMSTISPNWSFETLEQTADGMRGNMNTVMDLTFEFETDYVMDYKFAKPNRIDFKAEEGGDLAGVSGSWTMTDLGGKTLVVYRNTSDLRSSGFMMRKLLNIEPSFEMAIQASQTQYMIADMKRWTEASVAERKKMKVD